MDLSLFRTVGYERLFHSHTQQEASRLARWLNLTSETELQAATAALTQLLASQRPRLRSEREDVEAQEQQEPGVSAALRFLFDSAGSMQLFNPRHPSRSAAAYDYASTAASAVRTVQQRAGAAPMAGTLAQHIAALQADTSRCQSGRLLVFDGMRRWTANSTAASQLLDVVASLTLALATGRLLVLPPVPGSLTEFLLPLSGCAWDTLGLQLAQHGAGWALTIPDGPGRDASSEVRVVLSHGQVLDAAYLQAWNAAVPERSLSLHDFIGCLLRLVLRPGPQLAAAMKKAEQQEPLDLSVSLPAVVNEPLSFYLTQLQAVIDTGIAASRFRVRLSSSSSAFQHVAALSFLPQLPLSLAGHSSLGAAMVAAIAMEPAAALRAQTGATDGGEAGQGEHRARAAGAAATVADRLAGARLVRHS